MKRFYNLSRIFAEQTWDSMLEPLVSKEEMRATLSRSMIFRAKRGAAWRKNRSAARSSVISKTIWCADSCLPTRKIGVFTHPHDSSLLQNRCFLYHLIGNKTGEWKVPVGGMGAVARELEQTARKAGAEILTNVDLSAVDLAKRTVAFEMDGKQQTVGAKFLLVNFGRNVLAKYSDNTYQPAAIDEGSVFKINMLLRRLPKLKSEEVSARASVVRNVSQRRGLRTNERELRASGKGRLPDKTPCEVYCHTLTDDSILSPELRAKGFHTITLFGLDAPYSLFAKDNESMRKEAEKKFLASMNQWLEEPLEDCLAVARDGSLCIESKSPGRYRGIARHVSWQYFPGRADLAVRNEKGTSRNMGSRNRMGKCFPLRLERAPRRRGQWNSGP